MTRNALLALAACLALIVVDARPAIAAQRFASGESKTQLLELYTSQGCSSCPPAELWLSTLKQNPALWHSLVPVAFHVDYWDELGWSDPYSSHAYSQRQRAYASQWPHGQVYTPGFVLDGEPWRGWFRREALPAPGPGRVGRLSVKIDGMMAHVQFNPDAAMPKSLDIYLALLAFDQTQAIPRGENAGLKLRQDFVVIGFDHHTLQRFGNHYRARVALPRPLKSKSGRYALAAWVAAPPRLAPIQATGGWLTPNKAPTHPALAIKYPNP